MPEVIACIDGSAYSRAVCDFAALFADRADARVTILAVADASLAGGGAVAAAQDAAGRLRDHGFDRVTVQTPEGQFLEALTEHAVGAALVVMGKRGADSAGALGPLGSHIEPVLSALTCPTCLVSQLFLPLSRALIVLDSNPSHRCSMEFAITSPLLQGLELDLVLMDDGRHPIAEKLAAARSRLARSRGAAFVLPADNPERALEDYAAAADLLVLSREMLSGPAGATSLPGNEHGFWRRRMPILVC